ncbi:unnamed protein product [Urochloa humidicola]
MTSSKKFCKLRELTKDENKQKKLSFQQGNDYENALSHTHLPILSLRWMDMQLKDGHASSESTYGSSYFRSRWRPK